MPHNIRITGPKKRVTKPAYKIPLFVYANIFKDDNAYQKILDSKFLGKVELPAHRRTSTDHGIGIVETEEGQSVAGELRSLSPRLRRFLDNSVSREYHRRLVTVSDGSQAYAYLYEPSQIFLDKESRLKSLNNLMKLALEEGGDIPGEQEQSLEGNLKQLSDVASGEVTLRENDVGIRVQKMQRLLVGRGYILPCHGVDGTFGPETAEALTEFQLSEPAINRSNYGVFEVATLNLLIEGDSRATANVIKNLVDFNKIYCGEARMRSEHVQDILDRESDISSYPEESAAAVIAFAEERRLPVDGIVEIIEESLGESETSRSPDKINEILQELGILYDDYGDWAEALVAYFWGSETFDNWLNDQDKSVFDVPRNVRRFSSKMGQLFGTGDIFTERYRDAVGDALILRAPLATMRVSSGFGPRIAPNLPGRLRGSRNHKGVDLSVPVGEDVYAAHSGIIFKAITGSKRAGNYIVLEDNESNISTSYMHLNDILVSVGDAISAGEVIGKSGKSGPVTGPHLHFELRINRVAVNPMLYIGREIGTGREIVARLFRDKKKLLKISSEYGPLDEREISFEDLLAELDKNNNQLIYLDVPIGKEKRFGDNLIPLPFDYGEYPEFVNPADEMGWDIVIVPSESGRFADIIKGEEHNLKPVGLVPVNPDQDEWRKNTISNSMPEGKPPPIGNDKIILAPHDWVISGNKNDVNDIETFFDGLWQFEEVIWY